MQEFIFNKQDLQVLMQEQGATISIKIIYEKLDPPAKEFKAIVVATSVGTTGATVRGCPNPPGCD
ncbi:hypothetical protein GXP67_06180 [Rhodocytophaga rosea]|uniref:Uncharacterized protein n=1 Tax=Rhodocytophaga rosea TaxID=2704465 RepID=A0A6C0GEM5_9BACT|nr:hypothetical protein [Rhodocytophaga rosea]QHT66274.1 hypothetical protein GXP67_06180 [Rhodocytophaga rosea]